MARRKEFNILFYPSISENELENVVDKDNGLKN
jgi:hypothetical protein